MASRYQHTPGIPPMAYGFYHEDMNGHTIVGHGGDTLWFHSDLHLILDQNVGLFVSQNSAGKDEHGIRGSAVQDCSWTAISRRRRCPSSRRSRSAKADGALVAGNYIESRGSFTNILRSRPSRPAEVTRERRRHDRASTR